MQLEGDYQRPWRDGEIRASRIVLIGRDLEGAGLQRALDACLAG